MRKNIIKSCLAFLIAIFMQASLQAQFVVKVRPVAPVVVRTRPPAPGPRHIWVDGEWVWRNNQYVYTEGRWMRPVYPGARWIPGHWKFHRRRGGWFWVPGHWSRR
jgi:WXXGXW repeat (2 copies)